MKSNFRLIVAIFCVLVYGCGGAVVKDGVDPVAGDAQKSFKILFLGDTGFGESYKAVDLDKKGYTYSFENYLPLLKSADYTVVNLETPLTDLKTSPFDGKKDYVHWSDPKKGPKALKELGMDLVALANNHTLDYGVLGLKQTIRVLSENGLEFVGAGMNQVEAEKVFVKEFKIPASDGVPEKSFKLAVIANFEYLKNYDEDYDFYARGDKGGANMIDVEKVKTQIAELKKNGDVFVVVFPHWGENYKGATENQKKLGKAFIDAGADLVVGHGSHMMQAVAGFDGGEWILYGIGNFVFNSPGRYKSYDVKPYSFMVELVVEDGGDKLNKSLKLYPIFSDNLKVDYQGRFLTDKEFNDMASEYGIDNYAEKDEFGNYLKFPIN